MKGFNHDTVLDINFLMLTRADFKYQNNKDVQGYKLYNNNGAVYL